MHRVYRTVRHYNNLIIGSEFVKVNGMYHGRSRETCLMILKPEEVEDSKFFVEVKPGDLLTALYAAYNENSPKSGVNKDFDQPFILKAIKDFYNSCGYEEAVKRKFADEILNGILKQKETHEPMTFNEISNLLTQLLSPF